MIQQEFDILLPSVIGAAHSEEFSSLQASLKTVWALKGYFLDHNLITDIRPFTKSSTSTWSNLMDREHDKSGIRKTGDSTPSEIETSARLEEF